MVNDVDEVSGEAASAASRLEVVELVKEMPAEWRRRYVPCEHIAERLGVSGSAQEISWSFRCLLNCDHFRLNTDF